MGRRWLMMIGVALLCPMAAATTPASTPATNHLDSQSLPASIREKMTQAGLTDEQFGLWVEPLSNQSATADQAVRLPPIIRHQADTPKVPASTQKLITTFIALHTFGENHRWVTRISPKGVVINKTLHGDLIIQGFGDPAMTHERLRAMLAQVKARGIHRIDGDIIIDNLVFDNVKFDINAFDGQGMRAYNAAPNAFLVNFGTVEVDILPSGHDEMMVDDSGRMFKRFMPSDTQNAAVQVLPALAEFESPVQIGANGSGCLSDGKFALTKNKLTILDKVNANCGRQSYWLTFADADELAKKAVKGVWQSLGASVTGEIRLASANEHDVLRFPWLSYFSKPLSEQIYLINQHSNNVMTEQVALSLPLSKPKTTVSNYPSAFAFITQWWQTHLMSQPPVMSRASGLCRDCAIAPSAMAELLAFAYRQPNFEVFKASLPIAGQTGTMMALAKRDETHPAIGRAFVKTGTLNDVRSLAGYVLDQQNRPYVFVAMVNAPNAGHDNKVAAVLDEALAYVATLQ